MNLPDELKFNIDESTELLRHIFPNYPELNGIQAVPDLWTFLRRKRGSLPAAARPA
jgi:hypothetical protein